ncbi:MAG TPA: tRNA (adenosine(37)-N6)-threonylcarbamoyltransferase complex transferase subunit TsaD [Phycisphaerae bacterium]|nr:tRNA (adenosine(37)-N6)-threonylcarbamoyltransferase complex transferase subunit TsaD [Phycisphaerae bacterium]
MSDPPIILGIESSCDETAAALVRGGREVLSHVVASQIELHARFGGVVPEIASRAHIEAINSVVAAALEQSGVAPAEVAAVAVTHEPGLIGSLLVGLMAAKTLAWAWSVPLIGVNHVYAHAYAAALDAGPIDYPAVALICSGGHTALYRCGGPTDLTLLGATIDDAAGEAFDKVASILRLGYPGGPAIDRIAREGDGEALRFPRTLLAGASLDFSFSGVKTAVLYHVNGLPGSSQPRRARRRPGAALKRLAAMPSAGRGVEHLSRQEVADVAASFQAAVVDVLRIKLRRAARQTGARTLVLGGGVAANRALRAAAEALARELRCTLRLPELRFCLDNAAMVAGLACHYLAAGRTDDLSLAANATVRR